MICWETSHKLLKLVETFYQDQCLPDLLQGPLAAAAVVQQGKVVVKHLNGVGQGVPEVVEGPGRPLLLPQGPGGGALPPHVGGASLTILGVALGLGLGEEDGVCFDEVDKGEEGTWSQAIRLVVVHQC